MPKPGFLRDFFEKKDKKGVQKLLIMLVAGIALLVIGAYFTSPRDTPQQPISTYNTSPHPYQNPSPHLMAPSLTDQLEEILSMVAGAGEVRVMLTMGDSSRYFAQNIQENTSVTTEEDSEGGIRHVESLSSSVAYVMVRQNDGSEIPLLLGEAAPSIDGIIIVAQGGGDVAVRAALTHAVQALLGIPAHRIQVFQMQ